MLQYRTDLALEECTGCRTDNYPDRNHRNGITQEQRGHYFRITEIRIPDDESGKALGKGKGKYITLESEALSKFSDDYPQMAQELAAEIRSCLPAQGAVLVAGIGNQHITPDALGVRVTEKVLATRHLQKELAAEEETFLKQLRPVSVVAGGVLGQTGIESAEFLQAITALVQPSAMIAIDALACASLERLGTTIQISDTGISPGSGVANHRTALNAETLGIPVIGIGVPTVIGIRTIAEEFCPEYPDKNPEGADGNYQFPDMMVTPRDIDRLITQAAHLLACGINMALHPQMQYTDVASF